MGFEGLRLLDQGLFLAKRAFFVGTERVALALIGLVITNGSELAREEAGTSEYISVGSKIAFASKLVPTGIYWALGSTGGRRHIPTVLRPLNRFKQCVPTLPRAPA